MERPQRVRLDKTTVCIIIIIIFHTVGLAGFFIPALQPLFLKIVPLHLLLMLGVVVYSHQVFNSRFAGFIAATFTAGFAAEWVGVHTHLIFGNYTYGPTLGVKLWDIPLLIGVNWFLLVYAAGVLVQRTGIANPFARVLTGAIILTVVDVIIEPVAIRFNYWHWQPHPGMLAAPWSNYLGWLVVSALMLALFELMHFKKQGPVAVVLLVTQTVFFALLLKLVSWGWVR